MIAIRGHEEDESSLNRRNFIELLRWANNTDPVALSILEDSDGNATYLSPTIQNEIISLLANQIRQQISEKIKGCAFSLMADETRDVSGHEQLSVVVRVINREINTNNDRNQRNHLYSKNFCFGFIKLDKFDAGTLTNEIVKFLSSLNINLKDCIALCFDGLEDEGTERSTDARGLLLALKESLFVVTIFILDRLLAKSLNFGTAHTLNSSAINQISELKSEEEFSKLYDKITEFCVENNIDLNGKMKERRKRTTSIRFKDYFITSTSGQREEIDNKNKYRTFIFYPVIDSILLEMNNRFPKINMEILRGISSLSPDSSTFLQIEELKALCVMLQCDIQLLNNEIQVLKPMLNQLKPKKDDRFVF